MSGSTQTRGRRARSVVIARSALREAASRRLLLIGVVVSVVFVGLFALGVWLLQRDVASETALERTASLTFLTVFGLYAVQFLASLLAIVLGAGAVAGELDSGRALAVLARPLPRRRWLLERAGALAVLSAAYVVVMAVGVLGVARLVGGYAAHSAVAGIGLLVLQVIVVLATASACSTRLSVAASVSITAALYGLAWLGGITELVGTIAGNDAVVRVGVGTSLVMPSDAVWHAASYHLSSPLFLSTAGAVTDNPPFLSVTPPNALRMAWAGLHALAAATLAIRWLDRRDL